MSLRLNFGVAALWHERAGLYSCGSQRYDALGRFKDLEGVRPATFESEWT